MPGPIAAGVRLRAARRAARGTLRGGYAARPRQCLVQESDYRRRRRGDNAKRPQISAAMIPPAFKPAMMTSPPMTPMMTLVWMPVVTVFMPDRRGDRTAKDLGASLRDRALRCYRRCASIPLRSLPPFMNDDNIANRTIEVNDIRIPMLDQHFLGCRREPALPAGRFHADRRRNERDSGRS